MTIIASLAAGTPGDLCVTAQPRWPAYPGRGSSSLPRRFRNVIKTGDDVRPFNVILFSSVVSF
jgi:hypothetical protein